MMIESSFALSVWEYRMDKAYVITDQNVAKRYLQ